MQEAGCRGQDAEGRMQEALDFLPNLQAQYILFPASGVKKINIFNSTGHIILTFLYSLQKQTESFDYQTYPSVYIHLIFFSREHRPCTKLGIWN